MIIEGRVFKERLENEGYSLIEAVDAFAEAVYGIPTYT